MIQVENLSFSYQNNKVFKNLSFSIKKGEYLCIIGKNGSGKSTLAKLLAGLIFQQEGNIKISGYNTKNQKDLLKIILNWRKKWAIYHLHREFIILQIPFYINWIQGVK